MDDGYWERLPSQLFLKERGEIGDCWPCCIAAVLRVPREDVPHFLAEDPTGVAMDCDTQGWLYRKHSCLLVHVSGQSLEFPRWSNQNIPVLPVITCGPSPRSQKLGAHHAVVYVGHEMVYDPHPSRAGLTYIADQYIIVPVPPSSI
jgi:hypothetical protein